MASADNHTVDTPAEAHLDVEQLTDEAAHLSRGERDELLWRINHLDDAAQGSGRVRDSDAEEADEEMDFAEALANKNALA